MTQVFVPSGTSSKPFDVIFTALISLNVFLPCLTLRPPPAPNPEDAVTELPAVSTVALQKIIAFCEHDRGLHYVEDNCDCHITEWHIKTIFVSFSWQFDAVTIQA